MQPELTLITPMYNEAEDIAHNIGKVLSVLDSLAISWEFLLVNDGSTDNSLQLAKNALNGRENCHIISYVPNRGRGYALRQGFEAASGEFVITTESDISWGVEIIGELLRTLKQGQSDVVIASTYLSPAGYENVPFLRKVISSWGNKLLRKCYGNSLTMLSGMTRGYRADVVRSLYLEQNDKDIHLEIISKCLQLGYRIEEIPATISWDKERSAKTYIEQLKILKHAIPHLANSFAEGAVKVFILASIIFFLVGSFLIVFGTMNKIFLLTSSPMPNLINYGLFSMLTCLISFFNAILGLQLSYMRKSIIHMQTTLKKIARDNNQNRKNTLHTAN